MKEINIKLLGQNILVKPDEVEKKTKSGLILTDESLDKANTGKVVAVGTQNYFDNGQPTEFNVKIGDKVQWIGNYATEVEIDGEKYLVMTEKSLLGILK